MSLWRYIHPVRRMVTTCSVLDMWFRHVLYLDRQHHRGEEHEDDLLVSDPGDDRGKAATRQPVALLVARLQRLQVVMELFVLILC